MSEHPDALFRGVFETAPDAVVIVDAASRIVLTNRQAVAMLGYAHDELVGQELERLVPDGLREVYQRFRSDYLAAPSFQPMGLGDGLFALRHDGSEVPVELSISPLETDEGLWVSISLRDITDRLRIEADSHRMRDELIATVSHELRTPLTSIIGYAELLSDLDEADLSRRARELIAVIERNAERELRLVDDLLTMAFLDTDRMHMNLVPVDLGDVGRRVVADHALRARERGIQLISADAGGAQVRGDFYRLVQVLENLVTNALKFTRPGGLVEVRIGVGDGPGNGAAYVEVHDTGIGVPPEEHARLFDRLYRAPNAVAAQVQGAGLGLPIARAIVEAHDGRIELQSEVGVGTTIRVSLPLAPA